MTGRNEPCHCGSGKKFKLCHGKGVAPVPPAPPAIAGAGALVRRPQQEAIKNLEVLEVKGPDGKPHIGLVFHFTSGRKPMSGALPAEQALKLGQAIAAKAVAAMGKPS